TMTAPLPSGPTPGTDAALLDAQQNGDGLPGEGGLIDGGSIDAARNDGGSPPDAAPLADGARSDATYSPDATDPPDATYPPHGPGGGAGAAADGAAANACGICDRYWQCNAALDYWSSRSDGRCVDDRTGTGLRCNGQLDSPGFPNNGYWERAIWGLKLMFDSL